MSFFNSKTDALFFRDIKKEFLKKMLDTKVKIYKLDSTESKANIYGETIQKGFLEPFDIHAYIIHDDQRLSKDESGFNLERDLVVKFDVGILIDENYYPESGDVFKWNGYFYTNQTSIRNQFLNGQLDTERTISVICKATRTTREKLGIEDD